MTEQNYIQLSYQLINLTREDLDVINCIYRNLPGLDLNAFSLSLLYLGFNYCTDKQKIFLNAPVQSELREIFVNPVRMKVDISANQKLFNAIKKVPQGKIRRNYITAVLHAGIAVLIELSYLYKSYKTAENITDLYSINSFLLRFGLSTCVETYATLNTSNYIYDVDYLKKKYSSEITLQQKSDPKDRRSLPTKQKILEKSSSELPTPIVADNIEENDVSREGISNDSPAKEINKVKIEEKYNLSIPKTTKRSENESNKNSWLKNNFDKSLL